MRRAASRPRPRSGRGSRCPGRCRPARAACSRSAADAVDVGQPDLRALVQRQVDAGDARHLALPLPLLVARVLADHEHRAVAADDLALLAHRLDRRSYLHDPFRAGSGEPALAAVAAAATGSWICRAHDISCAPSRTPDGSNSQLADALVDVAARLASSATRRAGCSAADRVRCHGVSTAGPSAVIATVNSKCAASEPSWEKIAQPSPPTRTAGAAGGHHRLDREHHALLEPRALAGLAVVRHLRILVHAAPDAVADERAHDRKAARPRRSAGSR